jgi:hypothetical protein
MKGTEPVQPASPTSATRTEFETLSVGPPTATTSSPVASPFDVDGSPATLIPIDAPAVSATASQPRSFVDRIVTIWGWFFDILTILVSVSDVISDILVAIQFFQAEQYLWFGLVLTSLTIANIIYTGFMAEVAFRPFPTSAPRWITWIGNLPRPLKYLLIFPFAQFAPTLHWLKEQCFASSGRHRVTVDWTPTVPRSRAFDEEVSKAQESAKLIERMHRALNEHLETHILFYVETVVESIPQSIIQLLAVTFLGQATAIQVMSMSLSLISIVSKGYVVSHSFTIPTMIFKFLLASYDVFSLFYIFATLIAREEACDVFAFGSSQCMSLISYIWVWKVIVILGLAGFLAIVLGIALWAQDVYRSQLTLKRVGEALLFMVGFLLLSGPVAIGLESAKLIWVILWIGRWEPTHDKFPYFARLFAFVRNGNWAERMHYVLRRFLARANENRSRDHTHALRPNKMFPPAVVEKLTIVASETPYSPWRQFSFAHPSIWPSAKGMRPAEKAIFYVLRIWITLYGVGQVLSLVFPFISFALGYSHQNLLQIFCFVALSGSFLLLMPFVPSAIGYCLFLLENWFLVQGPNANWLSSNVDDWIAAYHVPPSVHVVRDAISAEYVPYDVRDRVAGFLPPNAINFSDLSVAELQKYRAT